MFDTAYPQQLKTLLPEFQDATGMTIDLEILGFVVYNERAELELSSASGANDAMTMVFIRSSRWIDAKWATDLTPMINDTKLTDQAAFALDDFAPGAASIFKRGQSLFAIPFFAGGMLLVYRKDILDANGYTTPPDTWEKTLEIAKKVNTEDVAAIMVEGQASFDWDYAPLLYAYGGKYYADPPNDLTPMLTSPEAVTALNAFVELMKTAPPGQVNFGDGEIATVFPEGKAAMFYDDVGAMIAILDPQKSVVTEKIAFSHVPGGPAGRFPQVGTHALMIPAAAKRKEASWEFIKWATSKDVMGRIGNQTFYPGVTRNSAAATIAQGKQYQYNGTNAATLHNEVLKLAGSGYMNYRVVPIFPQLRDVLNAKFGEVVTGQKEVEAGLQELQADWVDLLKKGGFKVNA